MHLPPLNRFGLSIKMSTSQNWWDSESLLRFKTPTSILISGRSQAGKSTLTYKILKHADGMFETPPTKILYAYKVWQTVYDEMERSISNIEFQEGLPSKVDLETLSKQGEHSILVLDDLLVEATQSVEILSLFTTYVHHFRITTIFISQNLFSNGKYMRSISLNTHYFILLKSSRDKNQYLTFARQVFAGKAKYMMDAYDKAVSKPYNYLLVDLYPNTPESYQLRTNILPGKTP